MAKVSLQLKKPVLGAPCNGCGYCCTAQPCQLAQEYLHCMAGPCVALEVQEGRAICGLVRNPIGYLFKATHPHAEVSVLDASCGSAVAKTLSDEISAALGVGRGCDADDDENAIAWPGCSERQPDIT